jgi:hypothetical protein
MELFQTKRFESAGENLAGYIAFPDTVSNELAKTLDPRLMWCRNFRFVATAESFVIVVALNWVTTGSPHAPELPTSAGTRISRFSRG